MPYNPNIHRRRSIRLKGYDYAQSGLYFVTICVQNRECLFGKIENGEMTLNDAGKMIEKWCAELSNKFPDIKLGEFVVMPNHFHAIIINTGNNVGADLRVCPNKNNVCPDKNEMNKHTENISGEHANGERIEGEHVGSPLHSVIQWFKTMTTNEYIRGVKTLDWQSFDKKLWQRNYHEHIIRNEQSHQNISNYIINNPANWKEDKFYVK